MTKKIKNKKNKIRKSESNSPVQPKRNGSNLNPADILEKMREEARRIFLEARESGKIKSIFEEAQRLALEAKQSDPSITKVYWFPHEEEVHLIEVDENTVESGSGRVEPFYFDPTESDPVPSGVAVIRPDEYRKLILPDEWGNWDDGQELEVGIE